MSKSFAPDARKSMGGVSPGTHAALDRLRQGLGSTLGLAVVGAVVYWAALPVLDWWALAWIAPVWWVLLVRRKTLADERPAAHCPPSTAHLLLRRLRPLIAAFQRPYGMLWVVGFGFWLAALQWLRYPCLGTAVGWVALAAYLGVYLPLFVGLSRVAVHRVRVPVMLAAPVVWTGLELARAHVLTGFTMGALSHTQYRWLGLIQVSDLGGAFAVDFVILFVATCLARMIPMDDRRGTFWPLLPALVVVGATLGYGAMRMAVEPSQPEARIALIQGSIDTAVKTPQKSPVEVLEHYCGVTSEAVHAYLNLDLIVWPEAMLRESMVSYDPNVQVPPDADLTEAEFRQRLHDYTQSSQHRLKNLTRLYGVPMLLGGDWFHLAADGQMHVSNSAVLVDREGSIRGRYDKNHPVMFGEYIPFSRFFPWIHRYLPLSLNLEAGTEGAVFGVGPLRLSPSICYETVLSHLIRRHVVEMTARGQEPDVLVNLTNDGWFRGSSELDMHLVCGIFRAVECRKPLLIAANTGFSAWIDADGRLVRRGARHAPDTILAEVRRDHRQSWYLRYGDLPAGVCLVFCIALSTAGFIPRLRRLADRDLRKT
jgi:apolipoprotein N-acyltransferase